MQTQNDLHTSTATAVCPASPTCSLEYVLETILPHGPQVITVSRKAIGDQTKH